MGCGLCLCLLKAISARFSSSPVASPLFHLDLLLVGGLLAHIPGWAIIYHTQDDERRQKWLTPQQHVQCKGYECSNSGSVILSAWSNPHGFREALEVLIISKDLPIIPSRD